MQTALDFDLSSLQMDGHLLWKHSFVHSETISYQQVVGSDGDWSHESYEDMT